MYGVEEAPRDDRTASPRGVRIVLLVVLACGLALAALPLAVILSGGREPGRMLLANDSGETLRGVRVIHLVDSQERLVGSSHELAADASTPVTFDVDGALSLRIEFDAGGAHHEIPLALDDPVTPGAATTIRIDHGFAVHVERSGSAAAGSPTAPAPPPSPAEPPTPSTPVETSAVPVDAGHDLPDGWSEDWRPWFRHIDWVIGPEAGMAAARASGKPMLMFYTATW